MGGITAVVCLLVGMVIGATMQMNSDNQPVGSQTTVTSPSLSASPTPILTPKPKPTPTPVPTPKVLLDQSGSGIETTVKFTAPSDWDLVWSYSCATAYGGSGNFQVFIYGSDGSTEGIGANELGSGGNNVDHLHAGGSIYLEVNSECSWHITAQTAP